MKVSLTLALATEELSAMILIFLSIWEDMYRILEHTTSSTA